MFRSLRVRSIPLLVVGLLVAGMLATLCVLPAGVLRADGPVFKPDSPGLSVTTLDLAGVSPDINNVAFAFDGKYSVVAPFETSDPDHQDAFAGDNHYLVVTEVANPSHSFKLDLSSQGQTCYYATHLIISSDNTAFVRATSADSKTHRPMAEVIAYGSLVLDKNTGDPKFDGAIITLEIPKFAPASDPGSMPVGFGVSKGGQFLVFTNGVKVMTVELATGDSNPYPVQPVPDAEYAPLPNPEDKDAATSDYETITSLDVDSNNVVSIVVNGRRRGLDFSRLYFYRLREGMKRAGTLDALAPSIDSSHIAGAQIAPQSQVAVCDDGSLGYFATTDGSFWSVELNASPTLNLNLLRNYVSLSGPSGYEAAPRNVLIDPSGRTLSVVNQGAALRIRRPTYGKHGAIRRPTYVKSSETPGLVLVQLNDKGYVASDVEVHSQGFGNGVYAISNPAFTEGGGAYVVASYSASSGALKLLEKAGMTDVGGAVPDNIGQIASPDGSTIVGLQGFDVSSQQGASPSITGGSLVFMSLRHSSDALVASKTYKPAIRRPCNVSNH